MPLPVPTEQGEGLTEDPAHVKQGGQLARLLGVQVIC